MNDVGPISDSSHHKFAHDIRQPVNVISLIVLSIISRITAAEGPVEVEYLLAKLDKIDRKLHEIENLVAAFERNCPDILGD